MTRAERKVRLRQLELRFEQPELARLGVPAPAVQVVPLPEPSPPAEDDHQEAERLYWYQQGCMA